MRDNPMLLAGVAVFIPMLVALVKDVVPTVSRREELFLLS